MDNRVYNPGLSTFKVVQVKSEGLYLGKLLKNGAPHLTRAEVTIEAREEWERFNRRIGRTPHPRFRWDFILAFIKGYGFENDY